MNTEMNIQKLPPSLLTDSENKSQWDSIQRLEELVAKELKHSCMSPKVSIVVPVFNEEKTIGEILKRLEQLPIEKQIIVVDDASSDGTREILEAWSGKPGIDLFFHAENQGKGSALQTGFRLAIGEIVIVQDADLEYSPEDILAVIAPIQLGEAQVVYGSRYLGNSPQDSSWIHREGNRFLTWFSNCWTGQKLTDMETCYKAFRRDVLQKILIQQRRFGFEPEITAKIARQQIRISEVPIRYQARSWKEGKKIGLRDLLNTLYCIVRYGIRD